MAGKLEAKARRNPGGLRLDEVIQLAEAEGFRCRRATTGHYICTHERQAATVNVPSPHPDKHVKSPYVRRLLRMIDEVRRMATEDSQP